MNDLPEVIQPQKVKFINTPFSDKKICKCNICFFKGCALSRNKIDSVTLASNYYNKACDEGHEGYWELAIIADIHEIIENIPPTKNITEKVEDIKKRKAQKKSHRKLQKIRGKLFLQVQMVLRDFKFKDRRAFNDFIGELVWHYNQCYFYKWDSINRNYAEVVPTLLRFLEDSTYAEYQYKKGNILISKAPTHYNYNNSKWTPCYQRRSYGYDIDDEYRWD